jgi:hypothetical protein
MSEASDYAPFRRREDEHRSERNHWQQYSAEELCDLIAKRTGTHPDSMLGISQKGLEQIATKLDRAYKKARR